MNVRPLVEAREDHGRFGGKAAELGRAIERGLPVPPGFAFCPDATTGVAERHPTALAFLADVLERSGGVVAVRSSAIGEDGAGSSFAGQHATILHVTSVGALEDAIRAVWSSARTEAALAYRKRLGIDGEPKMAVVVQALVDADCAGVLFTRDPITGHDERVIEAAWGLGEIVVAGLVTPDRYRLARTGAILERVAGEKDVAIRRSPSGGTHEEPVAPSRIHALCLDDAKLAMLGRLAEACEAYDAGPHDLEWAFASDRLYLLQRRAITR